MCLSKNGDVPGPKLYAYCLHIVLTAGMHDSGKSPMPSGSTCIYNSITIWYWSSLGITTNQITNAGPILIRFAIQTCLFFMYLNIHRLFTHSLWSYYWIYSIKNSNKENVERNMKELESFVRAHVCLDGMKKRGSIACPENPFKIYCSRQCLSPNHRCYFVSLLCVPYVCVQIFEFFLTCFRFICLRLILILYTGKKKQEVTTNNNHNKWSKA